MSGLDIGLIILSIFGAYKGYRQGFLMELFSLAGIVLGILGGFKLMGLALVLLSDWIDIDKKILPYVAFAIVFLLIVIVVNLVGRMLRASIDKSFLGRIDEAAGGILGLLKTAFLLSVGLWLIDSLHVTFIDEWMKESKVAPLIAGIAPVVTSWVSEFIPAFHDIFE